MIMTQGLDRALNTVKVNKKNSDQNQDPNCIPFTTFRRLKGILPGIEKSTYYCVTAGTGVGKSRFARHLVIDEAIDFKKKNSKIDVKINILLFSLEESKEKIYLSRAIKEVYTKYKHKIDYRKILSVGEGNVLSDTELQYVENVWPDVEQYFSHIHIYDTVKNPTGIYKECKKFLEANGTIVTKRGYRPDLEMEGDVFDYYKPNHPNTYTIIVVDNYNILQTEKPNALTLRDAMQKMSSEYALELRDKYGCSIVAVHQQALSQESVDNVKAGMTEPSLAGFGDNKTITRDFNTIIGLHMPDRFESKTYKGYDLEKLNGMFRSIHFLKMRDGGYVNAVVPCIMEPASGMFFELPQSLGKKATPEDKEEFEGKMDYYYQLTSF